jgi:hypothetical protein
MHVFCAGSSVIETTDGQDARHLSFESWLDKSEALVGPSSHGPITQTKKPICAYHIELFLDLIFVD